jgi:hypothetical protein
MADTNKSEPRAKRHHYLPQSYLDGFTGEDGLLCLFDRQTKTFRKQQPKNTALQTNFYTITDRQGLKSDAIERMFSRLESEGSTVIRRLDARHTGWRNEQERVSFAIYLACFYTRTPAFDQEQTALADRLYRVWMKANHPTAEVTCQWFQKFAAETGEHVDDEIVGEFFKMVWDDTYQLDVPRQRNIRLMIDNALHLAELLLTLNWTFVRAPHDIHFITSDAPFVTAPPPGETDWRAYGVLTPGAMTTIPLSPSVCVLIEGEGGKDRYGHMGKDAVRRVNANVAQNSDRFIIARNQPYLERLVKRTRVDQYRWTSRFEFRESEIDGDLLFHAKRTRPPVE